MHAFHHIAAVMERISNSAVQHSLLLSSPKILPNSTSSGLATHQEVAISTRSNATSHPTDSGHTTIAKISTLLHPLFYSIPLLQMPEGDAWSSTTKRCSRAHEEMRRCFRICLVPVPTSSSSLPSVLVLKLDAWRESELRILFCKDAPHIVDSCCWSWSLIRGNPRHGRGFDWGRRRGHVEVDVQYFQHTRQRQYASPSSSYAMEKHTSRSTILNRSGCVRSSCGELSSFVYGF